MSEARRPNAKALRALARSLAEQVAAGSPADAVVAAVRAASTEVADAVDVAGAVARVGVDAAGGSLVDLDDATFEVVVEAAVQLERGALVGAALVDAEMPKDRRKALKRAAHALRSRSVDVPEATAGRTERPRRPAAADVRALLTYPDGAGQRLGVLLGLPSAGRPLTVHFVMRDQTLVELGVYSPSGKESREMRGELDAHYGDRMAEVDAGWVASLIVAADEARAVDSPALIGRVAPVRAALRALAAEGREPPLPSLDAGTRMPNARAALALLEEPPFASWMPDTGTLRSCAERLDVAARSDLVVSEGQRAEQAREALRRSTLEYLTDERRASLASRLEEVARLMVPRREVERAQQALAAAAEVREDELPAFVLRMFERVFPAGSVDIAIADEPPSGGPLGGSSSGSSIILP